VTEDRVLGTSLHDDDSDDHAVDAQDACHDHWNDGLHDEFWFEHSHRADADSCLRAAVGCAQIGEDECGGHSEVSEEVLWAIFGGAGHGS